MKARESIFTLKVDAELYDRFMAAVARDGRSASEVISEMMRDYVARHQEQREYDDFLRLKVELARRQRDAGLHLSNEDVEAEAAARRAELQRRMHKAAS